MDRDNTIVRRLGKSIELRTRDIVSEELTWEMIAVLGKLSQCQSYREPSRARVVDRTSARPNK